MPQRPTKPAARLRFWALIALLSSLAAGNAVAASVMLSVDAYRGEESAAALTYLDFWASWCAPCRQSFPWMNEIQQKYADQGLRVVAVNLDTQSGAARRFLQEVPAQFAVVLDPNAELASEYAVPAMPTSYLVAPDGSVLHQHTGFRASDKAGLEARIQQLLTRDPRVQSPEVH